ncbi:MAG TPA: hypothetical protein VN372_05720 [Methanospirillum sp.]|nr:hypothetical protein [Methanospirillum sp.]
MLVLLFSSVILVGIAAAADTGIEPASVETIQPPSNLSIAVQIDQIGSKIIATFRGGYGQNLIKDIQIELIRPDGSKQTQTLGTNIGDSVIYMGSGCGDKITGTATYMSGIIYPFLNQQMAYVPGICGIDYIQYTDPCAEIAVSPSLKPDPIDNLSANRSIAIQANVDISTIDVEFRGGFGQNLIKSLQVTRYGADGSKETKDLGFQVGDSVHFSSSNSCMDRIGVDATLMDGVTYHIYDQVLHF